MHVQVRKYEQCKFSNSAYEFSAFISAVKAGIEQHKDEGQESC